MEYRDKVTKYDVYTISEIRSDDYDLEEASEYVKLDNVIDVLDRIESDLNSISNMLEPIDGLSEINDIKTAIKELLDNVY